MKSENLEQQTLTNQELISLLGVYLEDFKHRNNILWGNTFKLFYAALLIILLPTVYVAKVEFIFLPMPTELYRAVCFVMLLAILYVVAGYAKRLECCTETYKKMNEKLPKEYQRKDILELKFGKYFLPRTSYLLAFLMFFMLIVINALFMFYGI